MASTTDTLGSETRVSDGYRWWQLTIGVICMVMIANYQYGWTLFVPEIEKTRAAGPIPPWQVLQGCPAR